jgi:exopolyphosphatase/guanosine-5'-triphosphate,3'-diphosphate pyrophosphatase
MASKVAVIEIGTNSIKFCIGMLDETGHIVYITDTALPTRLGEGLDRTGLISSEACKRNVVAVAECVVQASEVGVSKIIVIGTAAVRMAVNAAAFRSRIKEQCGVDLHVLSEAEEARLSYEAVLYGLNVPSDGVLMTMDTGGGSTEFVFAEGDRVIRSFSVPLGAVVLTERWGMQDAVSDPTLKQARAEIRDLLSRAGVCGPVALAVGMGGGVTALAAAAERLRKYTSGAVHGSILTAEKTEELLLAFASRNAAERKEFANFPPGRADIVLAGACIVKSAMELVGAGIMTVSAYGLRHALVRELLTLPV